ncbi:hypothetical protein Tco_1059769 [Tanacetum coccineum]
MLLLRIFQTQPSHPFPGRHNNHGCNIVNIVIVIVKNTEINLCHQRTVLKSLFYDAMYLNYEKGEYDFKVVPIESISRNPDLKDNDVEASNHEDASDTGAAPKQQQ